MKNNQELKPWEEYDPKPWLSGRVPKYYWIYEDNIRDALQWLFEDILDIENNNMISLNDFKNNKLGGLMNYFNNSPYAAINYVYPNKYKPWEKCKVPNNYWKDEYNVKDALRWLFEDKLDIENNDNITIDDFIKYNLRGLMNYFNNSPYAAINYVYPNKYKPWEKCKVPNSYWENEDNVKDALRWLFEDKLDIENNDNITIDDFIKYGLLGLFYIYFNGSPYEAINYVYPNKYKPWEKCMVLKGYWEDEDNVKEALQWLFEEKLDIENNDNITIALNDFDKYGLNGLVKYFNNSPYEAINYVYPNRYKPWEKTIVPKRYWEDEDTVKEALLWLFEEKLDIENNNITITRKDFEKYKLGTLLLKYFNNSPYAAINYLYPNKYKAWEKSNVPMNYWKNEDNIKDALRWLFEEKCNINNVTKKDFKKYNLSGLLSGSFGNSPINAKEYYKSIK